MTRIEEIEKRLEGITYEPDDETDNETLCRVCDQVTTLRDDMENTGICNLCAQDALVQSNSDLRYLLDLVTKHGVVLEKMVADESFEELCQGIRGGTGMAKARPCRAILADWGAGMMDSWISVKTMLPYDSHHGEEYLLYTKEWGRVVGQFSVKGKYRGFDWNGGCAPDQTTTHYMPLPNPPNSNVSPKEPR